jgi:hypothetical protein
LASRLDDPNKVESVQQIRFFAHRFSAAESGGLAAKATVFANHGSRRRPGSNISIIKLDEHEIAAANRHKPSDGNPQSTGGSLWRTRAQEFPREAEAKRRGKQYRRKIDRLGREHAVGRRVYHRGKVPDRQADRDTPGPVPAHKSNRGAYCDPKDSPGQQEEDPHYDNERSSCTKPGQRDRRGNEPGPRA